MLLTRIIHERLRRLSKERATNFTPDAPRPDITKLEIYPLSRRLGHVRLRCTQTKQAPLRLPGR
jgi:hypothetical protein